MQDSARLTELTTAAENSQGSSQDQFEKTLESLEAKLNKLSDAWEEFLMGIANSDLIKGTVDALTGLLEIINKLTKGTGGLDSALMKLSLVGVAMQASGSLFNSGVSYVADRRAFQGAQKAQAAGATVEQLFDKYGYTSGMQAPTLGGSLKAQFADFGQRGVVGLFGNIFKGIKGLFTSTLTDELKKGVAKTVAEKGFETILATETDKGIKTKVINPTDLTGLVSGFKNLKAGFEIGNSAREELGNLTNASSALRQVQSASGGAATGMAKFGAILGSMGPTLLIVGAALGALALAAHLVYVNSDEYKLKKINEQIEGLNDSLDRTNESLDELKNWKDNQDTAVNKLKELTRGTTEFNQALVEANQNVLTLLQSYDGLKLSSERGKYGELQIDEKSLENLIEAQTNTAAVITSALIDKTLEGQLIEARAESRNASSKYFTTGQGQAYGSTKVTTQGITVRLDKQYENYQNANNGQSFADYVAEQFTGIDDQNKLMSAAIDYEQVILKEMQLQETADQQHNEELVKGLDAQSFFKGEKIEKDTADAIQLDIADNYFSEDSNLKIEDYTEYAKRLGIENWVNKKGELDGAGETSYGAAQTYKKLFGSEDLSQFTKSDGAIDYETLSAVISAELERRWQKEKLGEIMTAVGEAGGDTLTARIARGQLTQADLTTLASLEGDYSQFSALWAASGQTEDQFTVQLDQLREEAQAAIDSATARFTDYFGKDKAKEFGDLDSTAATIMSNFANRVKVAADDEDFQTVWDTIFPSDMDMKDKVKIAKALSSADSSSIDSIKAYTNSLVESGVITQDTADHIANTWIDLNNAVKKIDFSAVMENLQTGNKFIRDIKENQQRSFSDDEHESLIQILSTDGIDRSDWFTQTLDGDWVYLGSSIETLTQAIYDNTSALLGESRNQLEAKGLLQAGINKDSDFIGWINQGASAETYAEKVKLLDYMKQQAKDNKWGELFQQAGINLFQDWETLDTTNANGRDRIDDMYSQLSKLLTEDYVAQIEQIIAQDVSYKVQSQNPWDSKAQATEYLEAGDQANSAAYYQGMMALAYSTDGVNVDIINKASQAWDALGGSIENASPEKVKAYGQAMEEAFDEIARAQDRAHLDDLKDQIDELDDSLSEANYAAKASEIAQTVSNYLGIKVDGDFVQQYKDLIKAITEEGEEGKKALEELREEALKLGKIQIDPIEVETILNTDNVENKGKAVVDYLNQLTGNKFTFQLDGQADMQSVLTSIGTIIMQLALMKAAAANNKDDVVKIMTNAQNLMSQIADAMGFEMESTYEETPFYTNLSTYSTQVNGEGENTSLNWVETGKQQVKAGSLLSWSFHKKGEKSNIQKQSQATFDDDGNVIINRGKPNSNHSSSESFDYSTSTFDWSEIFGLLADSDLFDWGNNTTSTGRGTTDHMNDKDADKSSGSGSSDKGNSSKSQDKWENTYDWLYNLTADINEELKKREKLEIKYDSILKDRNKTAKELYENSKAQLESLEQSRKLNAEAYASRLAELKLEAKETTAQYSNDDRFNMKWGTGLTSSASSTTSSGLKVIKLGDSSSSSGSDDSSTSIPQGTRTMLSEEELGRYATFNWDDNTIEINWDLINQITDQQKGEAVEDYISKLEEIKDQLDEAEKSLLEIDGQIRDIIEQGKDEYESFEQEVFDALVSRYQKEIDKLDEINQSISDANSKLIDEMEDAIDKERQARDNQETEQDLTDKQKRLTYLQSDTSNANAMEILDLQKELQEGQRDYTDDLIDQKIEELKDQNDKAAEQRQTQIDLMTKNLEMAQENGLLWQEVYNLMDVGIDQEGALVKQSELFDLLQSEAGWQGMSAVSKMTWLDELTETVKAGMSYLMTGRQLEYIGMKSGQQINFTAYDENGKLQYLTGTVDKNGDVIDSNGIRYSEIFQNYDGSFTTMEKAGVGTKKETPKEDNSSGSGSGSSSSSSNRGTGNSPVWKIDATGKGNNPNGTILNGDGSNSGVTINDPGKSASNAMLRAMRDLTGDLSKYDEDGDGALSTSELKKALRDQGINWNDSKYQMAYDSTWDPSYKRYATGGLNTKAGPAWLDGTFSKPELVLNSTDTQNFLELRDLLRMLQLNIANPHGNLIGNNKSSGDNYYEIDINVDSIANDYDVSQMADKIKKMISQDALYRNGNAINRMR